MAMLDPQIHDQSYQFFIEEASELLQCIETGLLTLRSEHTLGKVHEIMRAAHSIKGGSASVGLEEIKFLAHRLEDFFKALYDDTLTIDVELEEALLQGFDCLKNPLKDQIQNGSFDAQTALAKAEPVFEKLELRLGDLMKGQEEFLPSSADLGIDLAASIFEVDVQQSLDRLAAILIDPDNGDLGDELLTTVEMFTGFAQVLNLPGFERICTTLKKALELHPDKKVEIAQLALWDFSSAQKQVLSGDRTSGGNISASLLAYTTSSNSYLVNQEEDFHNQAYQFFIEEAAELLQVIETGLFTLKTEKSKAKVHDIMRAAHSIKGGAASVGLETIRTIAHRLEDFFKALYGDDVEFETELEGLLLEGFDCLKNPLKEQIETGFHHGELALSNAKPIFEKIEVYLGDALNETEQYIPSSADLGIDITSSMFEIDVPEELERLIEVIASPDDYKVAGELRATAEVLAGFAELLNLPGLGAIASTIIKALELHPEQALEITKVALANFQAAREQVLAGDRISGGSPFPELLAFIEDSSEPLNISSLDEVFGSVEAVQEPELSVSLDEVFGSVEAVQEPQLSVSLDEVFGSVEAIKTTETLSIDQLEEVVSLVEQNFDKLPCVSEEQLSTSDFNRSLPITRTSKIKQSPSKANSKTEAAKPEASSLSVRVDFNRLERMNNLVGELAINRNSLSLQNTQLQSSVKELLNRFSRFHLMASKLRELSDLMLVDASINERSSNQQQWSANHKMLTEDEPLSQDKSDFDTLEMDRYGSLYSVLQSILEEMLQLEESVDDIVLFARGSNQTIEQQRQMLTTLRDELMWARMLPLGEVLNRFPRVLRDLSTTHHKSVRLKLVGTGVLVDRAALEKLYDPLLHLLRNAFDHGIEPPLDRQKKGKPEEGLIEIRAYHQGNQTIIEIKDDGNGLNLDKIRATALRMSIVTPEQLAVMSSKNVAELIFEPGFSTASKVSELSGRGVGLDVVRSQLQSLKGTVTVSSNPEEGTTFTLRLPLTMTIAKLLVCLINTNTSDGGISANSAASTVIALPSDSIEEIIIPEPEQIQKSVDQRFLYWQEQIIPIYPVCDLLEYSCSMPKTFSSKVLNAVPIPSDWGLPLLLVRRGQQICALEVSRLVTEQELVIKPFGACVAPPSYTYGCTILGDGTLIPVLNGVILLEQFLEPSSVTTTANKNLSVPAKNATLVINQTPTILVVDDSAALRRTLALTLQKSGYQVMQARDGREALEQLKQNPKIQLVICDVEMPNMNGFEFLGQRRRYPELMMIPVAMLTSRSSEKHRQLATHLGASAYFTKPYIEQQFLTAVENIIKQNN